MSGSFAIPRCAWPGLLARSIIRLAQIIAASVLWVACGNHASETPPDDGSSGEKEERGSGDADAGRDDWPANVERPEAGAPGIDPPAEPCGTQTPFRVWSFDDSAEGWSVNIDGAHAYLQWTNVGMLQVDVLPGRASIWTAQVELEAAFGDLTGKEVASMVYVDESNTVANVFARSRGESSFDFWANGDWTEIPAGSWGCVEFAVDSPDYIGSEFDATQVTRVGVHLEGSGPMRAFVDVLGY